MRTVQLGATAHFMFTTRTSAGVPDTLASGNLSVYEDGGTTEITGADTLTADFDTVTGLNHVSVACTTANGFEHDKTYHLVIAAGTTDSGTSVVGEVIAQFAIESASDEATRLLREALYGNWAEISTTTSNSTTAINLTDIVDAQVQDDALTNLLLLVYDATDGRIEHVVTTSVTSKVATVELVGDGGAMSFTVASGDRVWPIGTVDRIYDGANLTEAGGTGDHLTAIDVASISGSTVAATRAEEFFESIIVGTAQTGTLSTTQATSDLSGYADDELIGRTIIFKSGTADGQSARITDYANTNGQVTYTTLATAPANGDLFVII